jgi:hypothetical protein
LALALAACGNADVLTAPEHAHFNEASGGTYGSGGRPDRLSGGGGTIGSGGATPDGGETYGSGGITATSGTCEEPGGGTYGSGGRTGDCTITEPTP